MNGKTDIERVYTLEEAAEAMRMTTRGVAKVGKKHGLCMVAGRRITFTAGQLARLQEELTWVSRSLSAEKHGISAEASPESAFTRVLAQVTADTMRRSKKRKD